MTGGEDGDRGRDGSGDRWCGTRVRLIALTWAFHIFTKSNYSAFYYRRLWVCFSMENITLKFVGGIRIHAVYIQGDSEILFINFRMNRSSLIKYTLLYDGLGYFR